jgi:hypothetical protein
MSTRTRIVVSTPQGEDDGDSAEAKQAAEKAAFKELFKGKTRRESLCLLAALLQEAGALVGATREAEETLRELDAKSPLGEERLESVHRQLESPVVDLGVKLGKIEKLAKQEQDLCKEYLREKSAVKEPTGTAHFMGSVGSATVAYVRPQWQAAEENVDLGDLKKHLSEENFSELFEVKVTTTPKEDFEEKLTLLTPNKRKLVLNWVKSVAQTRRVQFSL